MDISCGEVLVTSKIENKTIASDAALENNTNQSVENISEMTGSDISQLKKNIEILQNQIDDLANSLGTMSNKLSNDLRHHLNTTIKKQRYTKRL